MEDKEGGKWNERTGEGEGPLLVQRRTGGFGALVEVPEPGVVLCQRTRTGGCKEGGRSHGTDTVPHGERKGQDRTNVTRYNRETERENKRKY